MPIKNLYFEEYGHLCHTILKWILKWCELWCSQCSFDVLKCSLLLIGWFVGCVCFHLYCLSAPWLWEIVCNTLFDLMYMMCINADSTSVSICPCDLNLSLSQSLLTLFFSLVWVFQCNTIWPVCRRGR